MLLHIYKMRCIDYLLIQITRGNDFDFYWWNRFKGGNDTKFDTVNSFFLNLFVLVTNFLRKSRLTRFRLSIGDYRMTDWLPDPHVAWRWGDQRGHSHLWLERDWCQPRSILRHLLPVALVNGFHWKKKSSCRALCLNRQKIIYYKAGHCQSSLAMLLRSNEGQSLFYR